MISFDAGEIADRQTDVERAGIDHAFGQQPVLVQPFKKAYAKAQQPGNAEQGMDQLFGAVVAVHLAVFLYVGVDLVVDLRKGVVHLQIDFGHDAVVSVACLQHHHANGKFLARVKPFVYHKPVQLRKFRCGAHICRHQQRHVADPSTLSPQLVPVILHRLQRNVDGDHVHRVAAFVHDVRRHLIHGVGSL